MTHWAEPKAAPYRVPEVVGGDTDEQEEDRSQVGRVAEEEGKQEGEEKEGGAVEERTRW